MLSKLGLNTVDLIQSDLVRLCTTQPNKLSKHVLIKYLSGGTKTTLGQNIAINNVKTR